MRRPEGWVYDSQLFQSEANVLQAWRRELTPDEFLDVLPLALLGNHTVNLSTVPIAPAKHYTDADIAAANHAAAKIMRSSSQQS